MFYSVVLPGPENAQDQHVARGLIAASVRLELIKNTVSLRQHLARVRDLAPAPCAWMRGQAANGPGDGLKFRACPTSRASLPIPAFDNGEIARGIVRKPDPARQLRAADADVGGGNSLSVPILSTQASTASSVTNSPLKACCRASWTAASSQANLAASDCGGGAEISSMDRKIRDRGAERQQRVSASRFGGAESAALPPTRARHCLRHEDGGC